MTKKKTESLNQIVESTMNLIYLKKTFPQIYDNGKEKEYLYSLYQLHKVASKYSRSYFNNITTNVHILYQKEIYGKNNLLLFTPIRM